MAMLDGKKPISYLTYTPFNITS